MSRDIVLIAHNIRSTHNVGSILRTCDGLGVNKIYLTGYTPYPKTQNDDRLPHIAEKLNAQIHKTALGAEATVPCQHTSDIYVLLDELKRQGYALVALEQSPKSLPLPSYTAPDKLALLIGEEVHGIEPELLALCDKILEIPMYGKKESFNVSVAAGMALYQLHFYS